MSGVKVERVVGQHLGLLIYLVFLTKFVEATDVTVATTATFNCSDPPKFENFDIGKCCRMPTIELGAVVEKCHNHIRTLSSHNSQYPVYAHVCYPDCIYRETGSLIDGDIHMEAVKNFLQNNIQQRDAIMVSTIVESFRTCIGNIKDIIQAKGIKTFPNIEGLGCSPYASMVYGCVNAETFLHCPQEMWLDERLCNLAKHFAQQCNPLPHVPMPTGN